MIISKENKKVFITGIDVITCVNNCQNKFRVAVYSKEPISNKNKIIRKRVYNELMKEYASEGMIGINISVASHAINYVPSFMKKFESFYIYEI